LQPKRDANVELSRRSEVCEVLAGTGISRRVKMDEVLAHGHKGSAPWIPVWKTGVYLSTLMLEEMESRAGIASASAVLHATA